MASIPVVVVIASTLQTANCQKAVQDNGLIVDDQEPGCLLIKCITHRCAHKMSVSRGL